MSPGLESSVLSDTKKMQNRSYPPEKMIPEPLLGSWESQMKPNRPTYVPIPPKDGECSKTSPTGLLSKLKPQARRWAVQSVVLNLILIVTILILIIVLLAQSGKKSEPSPADAACAVAACPDGWVGYLGKCYYFSETEGNWNNSQSHCSSFGASLAGIDTRQELDFLMRYKGPSDHWIGLRREQKEQPWMWTSGTEFNNWFTVVGGGLCAFLNHKDIASSGCSREGLWICSKPAEKTK